MEADHLWYSHMHNRLDEHRAVEKMSWQKLVFQNFCTKLNQDLGIIEPSQVAFLVCDGISPLHFFKMPLLHGSFNLWYIPVIALRTFLPPLKDLKSVISLRTVGGGGGVEEGECPKFSTCNLLILSPVVQTLEPLEHASRLNGQWLMGNWDSLLVRVPDMWSIGYEFESWPEQKENFLLQS